jgi:hypothetical protein
MRKPAQLQGAASSARGATPGPVRSGCTQLRVAAVAALLFGLAAAKAQEYQTARAADAQLVHLQHILFPRTEPRMALEVRKENQRILQRRELLRFAQGLRKEHYA